MDEQDPYMAYSLCGRLRSDGDRIGTVYHAVAGDARYGTGPALCGRAPGRRSAGWTSSPRPKEDVTCNRCLSKLRSKGGAAS